MTMTMTTMMIAARPFAALTLLPVRVSAQDGRR